MHSRKMKITEEMNEISQSLNKNIETLENEIKKMTLPSGFNLRLKNQVDKNPVTTISLSVVAGFLTAWVQKKKSVNNSVIKSLEMRPLAVGMVTQILAGILKNKIVDFISDADFLKKDEKPSMVEKEKK